MNRYIFLILIFFTFTFSKEFNLEIKGLHYLDKDDLSKALGVQDSDLWNFWSKKSILKDSFIKTLEPTLKGYLESHGFFDAKFIIKKYDKKIVIDIVENEPIRVKEVLINSDFDIKNLITWKKGEIFLVDKFNTIKENIIKKLLQEGYCKYKLNSKAYVDLKLKSVKIKYDLKKNYICKFGKVNIAHIPKDISKDVVISRLEFREGDRFDIRKIEDSIFNLNALNTFANLQIKYSLEDSNRSVDTDISLDTREKLKRYLISIGYESYYGARFRALWEKRNFFGNAKKIKIYTNLSHILQSVGVDLFIPAYLNLENRYFFDLYLSSGYSIENIDAYKEKRYFFNGYLDYSYSNWYAKVGLGIENLDIKLKDKSVDYVIGGIFNLAYPYIELQYDGRDSKIDPKNGFFIDFYSEYGITSNKGGVQYLKYLLEGRLIKTINSVTLSAVAKVGAIHEVKGKLPASKLFYVGGAYSNRAYSIKEVGIVTSNRSYRKLGGKSFLNLQLEANFKLYKKLYGAIFFDSTLISQKEYNFSGNRLDTIGFGFRYKTPIGPVKIDFGFNIHNRADHAISIMLGQSF